MTPRFSSSVPPGSPVDRPSVYTTKRSLPGTYSHRNLRLVEIDVLLELFQQLAAVPEKQDMRFVLALLLVRRRVLQVEESPEADANVMKLYCPRDESTRPHIADETPRKTAFQAWRQAAATGFSVCGGAAPCLSSCFSRSLVPRHRRALHVRH